MGKSAEKEIKKSFKNLKQCAALKNYAESMAKVLCVEYFTQQKRSHSCKTVFLVDPYPSMRITVIEWLTLLIAANACPACHVPPATQIQIHCLELPHSV
jgi:hypothetical protein